MMGLPVELSTGITLMCSLSGRALLMNSFTQELEHDKYQMDILINIT
jgi:hypothetical protein